MKIIYFMGKSASGKDTIYRKVKEKLNPSPKEIILYTTRPIRDHEENGREYFFVTDSKIAKMENEGKIIEKRVYHTVYGTDFIRVIKSFCYHSVKAAVDDSGRSAGLSD